MCIYMQRHCCIPVDWPIFHQFAKKTNHGLYIGPFQDRDICIELLLYFLQPPIHTKLLLHRSIVGNHQPGISQQCYESRLQKGKERQRWFHSLRRKRIKIWMNIFEHHTSFRSFGRKHISCVRRGHSFLQCWDVWKPYYPYFYRFAVDRSWKKKRPNLDSFDIRPSCSNMRWCFGPSCSSTGRFCKASSER